MLILLNSIKSHALYRNRSEATRSAWNIVYKSDNNKQIVNCVAVTGTLYGNEAQGSRVHEQYLSVVKGGIVKECLFRVAGPCQQEIGIACTLRYTNTVQLRDKTSERTLDLSVNFLYRPYHTLTNHDLIASLSY